MGLPVAHSFAHHFPTVGFDVSVARVEALRHGDDRTREATAADLASTAMVFTADPEDLRGCTFFVVVSTPIDAHRRPDLGPVEAASRTVGRVLGPGAVVVYESTVYPGVTEDICGPILAQASGFGQGRDFFLGYSPERINPGDKEHRRLRPLDRASARPRRPPPSRWSPAAGRSAKGARVGVLGLTFKENVPDLRNSKVPDIVAELVAYGAEV